MGLLNIIRRMHKRQKLSIREIARLTGVSRNTVTKHLAANTIEPKFATPERRRVPQSVGQLNFGIDAGKDFGCHPLLKSIS